MSSSNLYGTRRSGGGHGDVFTAPEVVGYMLDLAGYMPRRDLSHVGILEPSCGEGEFVAEIGRRLLASAETFGFDAREAFCRNVRAYDIDAAKAERCRTRLQELGFAQVDNIRVADFLRAEVEKTDIVVGNPPYVRYENLPPDMLEFCRATFHTFHYRADLYVPFFEKSLRLLRDGGVHCFICSNRWLKNEYGRKLRRLVAKGYRMCRIVNLERADAFQEEVLAYPAITLIQNAGPAPTFEYAESRHVAQLPTLAMTSRTMPAADDWTEAFVETPPAGDALQTIEQQGFKIGIGVATGADAVFISKELPGQVEPELIMPGIGARDLRGDKMQWLGEYLLNPYRTNGELIDLEAFPMAKAYLERHRERLSQRHVAKKNPARWYKTIDRISPTLMRQPKVLLPDMSGNTCVFVDDGHYYPMHNLYYITGRPAPQLRLLAAILMTDFVRQQLAAVTNQMNGGFPRWQSQHLRKLRIPCLNDMPQDYVQAILDGYERKDLTAINQQLATWLAQRPHSSSSRRAAPTQQHLQFAP